MTNNKKVVLVGTGMVGMSFAYAALNKGICDELVLVDVNVTKAMGEAMDLNHGLAFSGTNMKIYQGQYSDCADADIVVICAGVNQKSGESRLDLLNRNAKIFGSIIKPVIDSGFSGIFLVASNPVDILTRVCYELSGFDRSRVIGTGTTLDTARVRYMLGDFFEVDPKNIHAYVIGEHGDSEFIPWSQAMIATKSISTFCEHEQGSDCGKEFERIEHEVRTAGQSIIAAKQATYYGIGIAIVRIVTAILNNENSVLTVSTLIKDKYNDSKVFAGVPCIVNRKGIDRILELDLTTEEKEKFDNSCRILHDSYVGIDLSEA